MKTTINIQLTHEEAYALAKYLPTQDIFNNEDKNLCELKEQLCVILGVETYDL
jgi:hypothetical protein